jgi:hypothetical protein
MEPTSSTSANLDPAYIICISGLQSLKLLTYLYLYLVSATLSQNCNKILLVCIGDLYNTSTGPVAPGTTQVPGTGTLRVVHYYLQNYPTIQCCGGVTFKYRPESADPYLWLTDPDSDPDPAIFITVLQDGN